MLEEERSRQLCVARTENTNSGTHKGSASTTKRKPAASVRAAISERVVSRAEVPAVERRTTITKRVQSRGGPLIQIDCKTALNPSSKSSRIKRRSALAVQICSALASRK